MIQDNIHLKKLEKKVFQKIMADKASAEIEFKYSLEIYNKCHNSKYFSIAKPLRVFNKTIEFDHIVGESCRQIKNKSPLPIATIYSVGQAIGEFHQCLNEKYEELDKIRIHSDLSAGNVMIDEFETIYIIDFGKHPYLNVPEWDLCHRDLATFLINVFYKYPVQRIHVRNRVNKADDRDALLAGYESISGFGIDKNIFRKYEVQKIKEEIEIQKILSPFKYAFWKPILTHDINKLMRNTQ